MRNYFFLVLSLFFLLDASHASARNLQTAAWLENDHIIVKCGFGVNDPLQNAEITILQAPDRVALIKGRTDASGRFVFPVPSGVREGHGLVIVARAPGGSRYEWSINAPELYAASSLIAGFDEARLQGEENSSEFAAPSSPGIPNSQEAVANPAPAYPVTPPTSKTLTKENLEEVLDSRLDKQLASIRQQLADNSFAITITLILAAAGLLSALAGLFLYFRQRSK